MNFKNTLETFEEEGANKDTFLGFLSAKLMNLNNWPIFSRGLFEDLYNILKTTQQNSAQTKNY